jgi:membrane associated rhomboid family serine protease
MPTAMPPVTRLIIVANVLVFLLEMSSGNAVLARFALWPLGPYFAPWQLLTYGFLHASPGHLFFNMFAVYMFGGQMERVWGPRRLAVYYLACLLSAAVAQVIVAGVMGSQRPTLGASGGVFGILLAFALYFPHRRIVLLIPPIPMPAWLFVTLYGALELLFGVTGLQAGVAHFAHLGGMLGGYLLIRRWRRDARWELVE